MNNAFRTPSLALLAGLALAGCSVYAPLQPTVSGIREAHEIEASAGLQANGRLDASIVAAPVPHLLLAAAGCYRPRLGGDTYFGTRQWEAAAGTYLPLGPKCVLSGLLGYGYAGSERKSAELLGGTTDDLRTRYGKAYGQLNAHWDGRFGLVYRAVRLNFDELTYDNSYTLRQVPLASQWRHELLLYSVPGGWRGPTGARWRWQTRTSLGLSVPGQRPNEEAYDKDFYYTRMFFPTFLASVGLTFARRPAAR